MLPLEVSRGGGGFLEGQMSFFFNLSPQVFNHKLLHFYAYTMYLQFGIVLERIDYGISLEIWDWL